MSSRFEAALSRFDQENSQDPNVIFHEGQASPREVLYAKWLTDWVLKLRPEASEPLRLPARSQHHSLCLRAKTLCWKKPLIQGPTLSETDFSLTDFLTQGCKKSVLNHAARRQIPQPCVPQSSAAE